MVDINKLAELASKAKEDDYDEFEVASLGAPYNTQQLANYCRHDRMTELCNEMAIFKSAEQTAYDKAIEWQTIVVNLEAEKARMEAAVSKHATARGHERCWENDRELYRAFGLEPSGPDLPSRDEFLGRCAAYYEQQTTRELVNLDLPIPGEEANF